MGSYDVDSYPGRGGGRGTAIYGLYRYVPMCRCEGYGFQAVYSRIESGAHLERATSIQRL